MHLQKELLAKAQAEQKPLKEQLSKQGMRVNSLNASLHDKEKFVKKVTDEIEELVSNLPPPSSQTHTHTLLSYENQSFALLVNHHTTDINIYPIVLFDSAHHSFLNFSLEKSQ